MSTVQEVLASLERTRALVENLDGFCDAPGPIVAPSDPPVEPQPTDTRIVIPDARTDFGQMPAGVLNGEGLADWNLWRTSELRLNNRHGRPAIEQRLVPASNGSTRVGGRSELDAPGAAYEVRYPVRFDSNFDFRRGGKFGFGLYAGSAPTGGKRGFTDGMSCRTMFRPGGVLAVYEYSQTQTGLQKYGRDTVVPEFRTPRGEWIDVVMQVRLNSRRDSKDGSLRISVDGHSQAGVRGGIQWMSSADLHLIDLAGYSCFHGGNDPSWAPSRTNYIAYGAPRYRRIG